MFGKRPANIYRGDGRNCCGCRRARKHRHRKSFAAATITLDNLDTRLAEIDNIGGLFTTSGRRKDLDLDYQSAVDLARELRLPELTAAFGRPSVGMAHLLYDAPGTEAKKFVLPDGEYPRPLPIHDGRPSLTVLEIRGADNTYTMLPPSVHPCGETLVWAGSRRKPATVEPDRLRRAAGWLALAATVIHFYPENASTRYDVRMALAGALLRAGMSAAQVERYAQVVAKLGGDPAWEEDFVSYTERRLEDGRPATGLPKLIEALGLPETCERVFRDWLQINDDHRPLVLELATKLWGPPIKQTETEYRFAGEKVVDAHNGAWFDFETNEGGYLRDLMRKATTAARMVELPPPLQRWHGEANPREEINWLFQDLLPEMAFGTLAGQWGTYKTFVALDLADATMTEQQFIRFPCRRKGGVLFVAAEGAHTIGIRLQAVVESKCDSAARMPFSWLDACPLLVDASAVDKLVKTATETNARMMAEFGVPLVLIIVDTIAVAAGYQERGDQQDSTIGMRITATMSNLAKRTNTFVLGVDHFGKSVETGIRGTSTKETNPDVILALLGERNVNGKIKNTRLAIRKRKTGENGEEFAFSPQVVQLGVDGGAITSVVIEWLADGAPVSRGDPWESNLAMKTLKLALLNATRVMLPGEQIRVVTMQALREAFKAAYPPSPDPVSTAL